VGALAGAVQVPRLQEQVWKSFFQAFGDTHMTALTRSLQRAVQVPELQDHLKEVLLGSSQSDELLARPESADQSTQTKSGLILPSAAETSIFGGKIDLDRAFLTFVLTGLLLPVIMSPALATIRDYTDWCIFPIGGYLSGTRQAAEELIGRPAKPALTLIEPDLAVGCLAPRHDVSGQPEPCTAARRGS